MADKLREEMGELAKNVRQLVAIQYTDVEAKVATENRFTKLEQRVALLMWVLVVIAGATILAIVAAVVALMKGS